ncbi:MAG: hypothetical protein WA432_02105 [Candidatus Babeliaceae bacterium]
MKKYLLCAMILFLFEIKGMEEFESYNKKKLEIQGIENLKKDLSNLEISVVNGPYYQNNETFRHTLLNKFEEIENQGRALRVDGRLPDEIYQFRESAYKGLSDVIDSYKNMKSTPKKVNESQLSLSLKDYKELLEKIEFYETGDYCIIL